MIREESHSFITIKRNLWQKKALRTLIRTKYGNKVNCSHNNKVQPDTMCVLKLLGEDRDVCKSVCMCVILCGVVG